MALFCILSENLFLNDISGKIHAMRRINSFYAHWQNRFPALDNHVQVFGQKKQARRLPKEPDIHGHISDKSLTAFQENYDRSLRVPQCMDHFARDAIPGQRHASIAQYDIHLDRRQLGMDKSFRQPDHASSIGIYPR